MSAVRGFVRAWLVTGAAMLCAVVVCGCLACVAEWWLS